MGEYLLRIVSAAVVGFVVGMISNRENATQSSRVFALISMGAALLVVISTGMFASLNIPKVGDPSRLPAQIISALGFLGTGMIWVTEDKRVMGVTSAASLWITAILGMSIGVGLDEPAALGVFIFILIYWIAHHINSPRFKR